MMTSPLPAAAPGLHLPAVSPAISGGPACDGSARAGQPLPLEGAQLGTAQPWAPPQQPAPWQQDKEAMDSLAAHHNTLNMSALAQQQQQSPLLQLRPSAAGPTQAPSIFADMPVDELPLAMIPGRQVKTLCSSPSSPHMLSAR
jgi:hypothetical protein